MTRYVIVGGGPAAYGALSALQAGGAAAEVTVVSAEPYPPYDRTKLSKQYLLEEMQTADLFLQGAQDVITYSLSSEVAGIDKESRRVFTRQGTAIEYEKLLLATGSRPRRLPYLDHFHNVHYLRTIDDFARLKKVMLPGQTLLVVGGGFIGLEVAAAAAELGARAIVVEAQASLLSRSVPSTIGRAVQRRHELAGVAFRFAASIAVAATDGDSIVSVEIDGEECPTHQIVVGIGVVPNIELAEEAGIATNNGIVIDERYQTSDPAIFAAGEVTCSLYPDGTYRRAESWRNSMDQGKAAGAAMLGSAISPRDPPWNWSDQFDLNIQTIGHFSLNGQLMVKIDQDDVQLTVLELDDSGSILGAAAINNGRDISLVRRVMRANKAPQSEFLESFVPLFHTHKNTVLG